MSIGTTETCSVATAALGGTVGSVCVLVLAATIAASVSAQQRPRPDSRNVIRQGPVILSPKVPYKLAGANLVENADGSFVSDIDGKRRNFGFRPGSIHSIRGKGFGRRSNSNVLTLKSRDGRYAANLIVTRWDDDLVVAQVPVDQGSFPSSDTLTLLIMTAGGARQFRIEGGTYRAEEVEMPLAMSTWERAAFATAGLRVNAWNKGSETFTAERDGTITITRSISYRKDARTTPCPAPGGERIDLNLLTRALKLQPRFRITRIAMTNGPTNGHLTGRYAGIWRATGEGSFYDIEWGVWRLRRATDYAPGFEPFSTPGAKFGKHRVIPTDAFAYCGSEFTLAFFVTGPRGLSPR